jgi:hypothetical protein
MHQDMKKIVYYGALSVFMLLTFRSYPIEIGTSYRQGITSENSNILTENIFLSFLSDDTPLLFLCGLSLNNEREYGEPFHGIYYGPLSVDILEGGVAFIEKGLMLRAGVMKHTDILQSPYSLFISGLDLSAPILEIEFENEKFFYSDRWIGLTIDSAYGWPDRGAVQKNYALKFGKLRIGFQDAVVFSSRYTDRSRYFDLYYFLNPIPSFFSQYVMSAPGRPWTKDTNDNSIMGFFADYRGNTWYAYTQLLVDDFNSNRFWTPGENENPDKIAWSIGGNMTIHQWGIDFGKIGVYQAGATAYTFESIGTSENNPMYSYSYYPADSCLSGETMLPITIEDNMVGYQHGENNLAFLLTWNRPIWNIRAEADLEFVLSGSKAAGNPWHEYSYYNEGGQGTKFLDDPVLEKKLLLRGKASYSYRDFIFSLDFTIGGVWNRLALRSVETSDSANTEPFYSPSNDSAFIGSLGITVSWKPQI